MSKAAFSHRFFSQYLPIDISRGNLPHWEQKGCSYFVTFRLADSIPAVKLDQWRDERRRWLAKNPPPHGADQHQEYRKRFTAQILAWLKQEHGSCLLKNVSYAGEVASALEFFEGQRYWLHRYAVMSNHVHALLTPTGDFQLRKILHSWKSFSANSINRLANRQDELWQRENYDTIIRDAEHLERVERYIDRNIREGAIRWR